MMMCYKDKSFCSKSNECQTECDRKLTEVDKEIVKNLGVLVSYANFERDCGKYKPKDKQ